MFDKEYYRTLSDGEESLIYLKKCIAEADNEKNIKDMLELRGEYIAQATFYDDPFKAMVIFPEFMKLFEDNPDVISPSDFMIAFKWIIEECVDYYQVSREQIERYFERFEKYIGKYGYTMRTYYLKKTLVYRYIDRKTAIDAYERFDRYKRSDLSDCAACEASQRAIMQMRYGSAATAVKLLNEMQAKEMTCTEVPQVTYGAFAYEFAKRGMYNEADHYADLMLPMIKGNEVAFMREIAYVINVKTVTAPNCAFDLFCENAGRYSTLKTPSLRFGFAAAAYRLFAAFEKHGIDEVQPKLSPDFELFSADRKYSVSALKEHFYNTAKDIAKKFDDRNGNNMFSDELAFEFPEPAESADIELPVHGSHTPEPGGVGVLFRSREAAPSLDEISGIIKNIANCMDVNCDLDENGMAYMTMYDDRNRKYKFRAVFTAAPDMRETHPNQYARGMFGNIDEYKTLLIVISDNTHLDRFEDMRLLFRTADALNTDDARIFFSLPNNKWHWSDWLKYCALSDTPPQSENMIKCSFVHGLTAPDSTDIITDGLSYFGSRELIIRDVPDDDEKWFYWSFMLKLAEAVSFSSLPDEGVTMNSGIVYKNDSFIRLTWRSVTTDDGTVYAEPLLLLTSRHKKGKTVTELADELKENAVPRMHRRAAEFADRRAKNLYPYALEYFKTHGCKLTAAVKYIDSSGIQIYVDLNVQNGGETGIVTDSHYASPKDGDVVYIEPDDVYWFCIEENGEKYEADDLWTLF